MKKKILPICLIATMFLMVFTIIIPYNTNIIGATSYSYGFDNVAEYATGGTYNIFTWSRLIGNQAYAMTPAHGSPATSLPLSLYMSETVGDVDSTNVSLSSSVPFNNFEIWFYPTGVAGGGAHGDTGMYFYNSSGKNICIFDMMTNGGGDIEVHAVDYGNNYLLIGTAYESEWSYLKFQNNHSSTNPFNYVYYEVGNTTSVHGMLECSNLVDLTNFNQSVKYWSMGCENSGGTISISWDDFSIDTSYTYSPGGPTETYDEFCSSDYYGDRTIQATYLEMTGGSIWLGRTVQSLEFRVQDTQFLTCNNLGQYELYAFNHYFGNPTRWEQIGLSYYNLIWDDMNYIWDTPGNAIEIKNGYGIWYIISGVPSGGYLYAHNNSAYWKNNAYMDGTYQNCGFTYCINLYKEDVTTTVDFDCLYNDTLCLPFNNNIRIGYIITPGCPIYYFLEDNGGFIITEGGWAQSLHSYYFEYFMDQSLGMGNFTFYLMRYEDFLLHGKDHAYTFNYTFCVAMGNLKNESIFTEKSSYFDGEKITIFWRGYNNIRYTVWLGGNIVETAWGDDTTHVLRDIGHLFTSTNKDERRHVALKYYVNGTVASEYYFTLKYVGNMFIIVKPNPVQINLNVKISGSYGTYISDFKYITIKYLGVTQQNITVGQAFTVPYLCKKIGDYSVYMMADNNEVLDSYTWKCTESGITNPNTGVDIIPGLVISPEIKALLGVMIVSCFTLIPVVFIFVVNSKRGTMLSVPTILYGIFMGLGLVVSIVLGFFEYWVMFFMLFFVILILAVTWLTKSKEGT